MPIEITSTTDSPEAVTAALGSLAQKSEPETTEEQTKEISASDEVDSHDETETDETTEESEPSENDEESQGEEDKPQKPKKKEGGFQRRIKKLTSKLSEKEREIQYWREQALRGSKPEQINQDPTKEKQEAKGKPHPDDFDTHEEYVEALIDWKAERKLQEREVKERENRIKAEQERLISEYQKRVDVFKKDHPDFDEVIEEAGDIKLSLTVQETILSSELGPHLAYALAKDPDELERINRLPPIAAARELGKLEARLSESPKETKPRITKAPPPPRPVSGKSEKTVKKSIYDPDLSFEEYERLRMEMRRA